jgi:hypothetical protein
METQTERVQGGESGEEWKGESKGLTRVEEVQEDEGKVSCDGLETIENKPGERNVEEKAFLDKKTTLAHAREESPEPEALTIDSLPPWKRRFILSMRRMPLVTLACSAANISPKTAYAHRESDKAFQALWDESLAYSKDSLEKAAWERGRDGVEKTIYGKDGAVIGSERVYSDKLLEVVLKGNLPEKYRENTAPQLTVNVLNWSNGAVELPQPVEDKLEMGGVLEMDGEIVEG